MIEFNSVINGLVAPACNHSPEAHKFLGLPDDHEVFAALSLGYPCHKFKKRIPRAGGTVRYLEEGAAVTPEPERKKPLFPGACCVRGRGLEPLWLLTASTSTRPDGQDSNDLAGLERQETSENVPERHILAPGTTIPGSENCRTGGTSVADSDSRDHVVRQVRRALDAHPNQEALVAALCALLREFGQ